MRVRCSASCPAVCFPPPAGELPEIRHVTYRYVEVHIVYISTYKGHTSRLQELCIDIAVHKLYLFFFSDDVGINNISISINININISFMHQRLIRLH